MTDKEIIIDGVDVSGCDYFMPRSNGVKACDLYRNAHRRYGTCECGHNCYYKQLKRLEQENARLKEEIKEVKKYQYEQEYLDKVIENIETKISEVLDE